MESQEEKSPVVLSEARQKIFDVYVENPNLSVNELADKSKTTSALVERFLASEDFEVSVREVARKEKHRLVLPALRALGECLTSKNQSVRRDAAVRILEDEDVLKKPASCGPIVKDNKILLMWKDGAALPQRDGPPAVSVSAGGG